MWPKFNLKMKKKSFGTKIWPKKCKQIFYQTDALIISHEISPNEVTPYNITFRYFGVITMFATLIMTPLWSAYTEAYTKNDIPWIKNIIKCSRIGLATLLALVITSKDPISFGRAKF